MPDGDSALLDILPGRHPAWSTSCLVDILKALASDQRLQLLDRLKDPRAHLPSQRDGLVSPMSRDRTVRTEAAN